MKENWLDKVSWDALGLVTAIAQEAGSGRILSMAWMNRDALSETFATRRAVYWSRSRSKLWRKGEESGHFQLVRQIRIDCDGDAVILEVEQVGGIACHTGHGRCFFRVLRDGAWVEDEDVLRHPDEIYRNKS